MNRRIWPAALALLALLVLGSYLVYTQYLVNEIKAQSRISSRIFTVVQQGALSNSPDAPLAALLDVQTLLDSLDVPMVYVNAAGEPAAWASLPFAADRSTPEGMAAIKRYAEELHRRNPQNRATGQWGTIYFGEPPLIGWLRWVPWLQVTAGLLLVLVAAAMLRADMRAERERLWAAMARELAHQMGTPLSSLAGWMEVLALPREERESMASTAHIAGVLAADVERLERVARRFELIGKPPVLEPTAVRDVVSELQSYFAPRLPRLGRGIRMRTRVAAGLPAIQANRVLLVWALENVVKNSIDALSGQGGRIVVVAHADVQRGDVHIHVADNGPGIAPHVRDRIFEAGVSTKAGGWGVGLALTRRIIEQLHAGRVEVRARPQGGTIFDVQLPSAGARR
jgi:signal transduction histidine kinase